MIEELGPYRIERLLGRGGMGTVYAGVHRETGQRAAIKSLSVSLSEDTNLRERFLTEIETLKKLKHPNIVELYGDGEHDGQLFYAMELIEGPTLQEELHAGHRFEWQEVVQIAIEVCQALKHAHDRGIIHRDLKPANLLRNKDGHIKLSDFGIAKLFGVTHLTAHGSVVGTADYMAPEQAEGSPITNRTDLYSLGAVLFTLLARRPPFVGSNLPLVFQKLRTEEAPPVRRFAPATPVELEQIIQQLLLKDPIRRIPTALALTNRLKALQHGLSRIDSRESTEEADEDFSLSPSFPSGNGTAEDPTRVVHEQGPPTEMAPTAIVPEASSQAGNESNGDQATLQSVPGEEFRLSKPVSRPTVAENRPEERNRFTWRNEAYDAAIGEADSRASDGDGSHLQAAGLAAALVVIIAAVTWAAWPLSADALYRRIRDITAAQPPEDAVKYIDDFLRRFPNDPRIDEVAGLRGDVESNWLQSRLALKELKSGGSKLEPFERDLLLAMRTRGKDPDAAAALLRKFLDDHGRSERPSLGLQSCLKSAKHLLTRISPTAKGDSRSPPRLPRKGDASLRPSGMPSIPVSLARRPQRSLPWIGLAVSRPPRPAAS